MKVAAVDISVDALAVARENARRMGVEVDFAECDILRSQPAGKFDAVVSNPPYIPRSAGAAMHRNVTDFEPREALFVPDDNPLLFYEAIARMGVGRLYFEIYEHFAHEVCRVLRDYETEVRRDINGRERMVRAVKR
jgi:release factor glutamine methyltransferase